MIEISETELMELIRKNPESLIATAFYTGIKHGYALKEKVEQVKR